MSSDASHTAFVASDIEFAYARMLEYGAKIVLIDIPIGLPSNAERRQCDEQAKEKIGSRKSAVFPVPCRKALDAYKEPEALEQKKQNTKAIAHHQTK